jgi:uncharacterized NAD(P)/FAD-binding protein YdhS
MQTSRSPNDRRRVIIIGGGASGVLLACHLLRRPVPVNDLDVTLIEKRSDVGRGIAYYTANPDHLLNVRAANMSAFPDQPDHFWRWLCARQDNGRSTWEHCGDPFCFVPRRIYGDYIASLIAPLLSDGEESGGLRIIRGECTAIDQSRYGVAITLADGSRHQGDFAVLATGHETALSPTDYHVDPWIPPADAGVQQSAKILIVGTGLTMIDYVLSLILVGHKGPIVALSRRGLLPRAHRSVQPLSINPKDVPFDADIARLFRWLRRIIKEHTAQGDDWRSVIDGIRPFSQQIWQGLSISSRRRFLEHARAWWDVHRHRMAPEVEERINAAIASGHLTVLAAKLCAIESDGAAALVHYRRRGAQAAETMEADKVVDCRAIGATPVKVTNPAVSSLLERGLARLDPLHIGLDVTPDCALIDRFGATSERLFAVGPLTRAAFWEIVAVPDIRNQCTVLASRLLHGAGDPVPTQSAAYDAEGSANLAHTLSS